MLKYAAALVAVLGLSAAPVLAAEQQGQNPTKLTDHELDQVQGGDGLLSLGIMAPITIGPPTINLNVPITTSAVVQANVAGTGSFQGMAIGNQYNWYFPPMPAFPGG